MFSICNHCLYPIFIVTQPPPNYPNLGWAIYRLCSNPLCLNRTSYVCDGSCRTLKRATFTTKKQLRDHARNKHGNPIVAQIELPLFHSSTKNQVLDQLLRVDKPSLESRPHNCYTFPSLLTNQFCKMIEEVGMSRSIAHLVKRASCQISNPQQLKNVVDPSSMNIRIFLNISLLVSKIGIHNLQHLQDVLTLLVGEMQSTLSSWLPLPTSKESFSKMITNLSNKNSLFSILPIHSSGMVGLEHATVPILSILALRMMFPMMRNHRHMAHPKVKSLLSLPWFCSLEDSVASPLCPIKLKAFLIVWSDGWDPFLSTKGNRRPVWSMTTTMLLANSNNWSPVATFTELHAVGTGKSDHNEVVRLLASDLESLKSHPVCFFHSGLSSHVSVDIELGLVLQDQPERRSMCGLQNGNSKYHPLFGLSCNFSKLKLPFVSCPACMTLVDSYIDKQLWDEPIYPATNWSCQSCYGWCLERLTTHGSYDPNNRDPMLDCLVDWEDSWVGKKLSIGPTFLSPQSLKNAWQYAVDTFCLSRRHSEKEIRSYLAMHCFNQSVVDVFIEKCRNYSTLADCLERPELIDDPDFVTEVIADNLRNPNDYSIPSPPAMLDLIHTFESCPETPMHQFMGVTKAIFSIILDWATSHSLQSALLAEINPLLKGVQTMSLDQYPAITIKGDSFGGYVGENYRCLCQLSPWLFRCLSLDKFQQKQPDSDPDSSKPIDKWTLRECRAWMTNRGLALARNTPITEARSTISSKIEENPNLPSQEQTLSQDIVTTTSIRRLIWLLFQSTRSTMGTDEIGSRGRNRSTAHTMKFLHEVESIDSRLRPDRKSPVWLSKFNFVSLLRTSQHFDRYGLVRNLHEGGVEGEGAVKVLRPLFPKCPKDGWQSRFVSKCQRERSLQYMVDYVDNCSETNSQFLGSSAIRSTRQDRTTDASAGVIPTYRYRRYKSSHQVRYLMDRCIPVSLLSFGSMSESVMGAVISVGTRKYLSKLVQADTIPRFVDEFGFHYFEIEPDNGDPVLIVISDDGGGMSVEGMQLNRHILLLPIANFAEKLYALLDDEMSFSIGIDKWSIP